MTKESVQQMNQNTELRDRCFNGDPLFFLQDHQENHSEGRLKSSSSAEPTLILSNI